MNWRTNDLATHPLDDAVGQFIALNGDMARMPTPSETCVSAIWDAMIVVEKGRRHLERLIDAFGELRFRRYPALNATEFDYDALAENGFHALPPEQFWLLALQPFCVNSVREFILEEISSPNVTVHSSWFGAFESRGVTTFLEKFPATPRMG